MEASVVVGPSVVALGVEVAGSVVEEAIEVSVVSGGGVVVLIFVVAVFEVVGGVVGEMEVGFSVEV